MQIISNKQLDTLLRINYTQKVYGKVYMKDLYINDLYISIYQSVKKLESLGFIYTYVNKEDGKRNQKRIKITKKGVCYLKSYKNKFLNV